MRQKQFLEGAIAILVILMFIGTAFVIQRTFHADELVVQEVGKSLNVEASNTRVASPSLTAQTNTSSRQVASILNPLTQGSNQNSVIGGESEEVTPEPSSGSVDTIPDNQTITPAVDDDVSALLNQHSAAEGTPQFYDSGILGEMNGAAKAILVVMSHGIDYVINGVAHLAQKLPH